MLFSISETANRKPISNFVSAKTIKTFDESSYLPTIKNVDMC